VEGTAVPFFVKFTFQMILKNTVEQTIIDFLSQTDYYLVDLTITTDNKILVEIDSFDGVSIDFCADLSRHIESQFDRETEDFELQVSSAGLTEPFKVLKQYEKNLGNEVEVLTKDGKKLTGILEEANEDNFVLQIEKTEKPEGAKRKITVQENITFNYSDIKYTKYIIRFK
jgi:ribosome maturation factor RimP